MKCPASHGRFHSTVRLPVLFLIAGLSLPLLAGCPGTLGGKDWPPPGTGGTNGSGGASGTGGISGACNAPMMIFADKTCNATGCHSPGAQAPDLSGSDPFPNLMGKNAVSPAASACVGMPYAIAGSPPGGVLMKRISGDDCGAGTRMPPGLSLSPTEIDCVASWLSSKL